jgi:hypothetical protein
MFGVLSATQPYLVLRNFETLPDLDTLGPHPDLDLLTTDPVELAFAADGTRRFRRSNRVAYTVEVGGRTVDIDLRHVGDGYYDTAWQRDMLATCRRHSGGFPVPEPAHHFHALLYHGLLHKPDLAPDYAVRLEADSESVLGRHVAAADFLDRTTAREILDAFMEHHGYRYSEPIDLSVPFRDGEAPGVRMSLRRHIRRTIRRAARGLRRMLP